ncbi:cell division protein FtsA [Oceanicella actignis]|uniref:Cell division protein FtsA n=1 Tax=Oceanicella actignis TaxID=1189325 RepID=A0A1M7SBK5_9RHOB|nr:cell division protein FtsA [Oceanicella actignis]SET28663.1 cell division protein FtsA [Oceanicella actignis]SHN55632.1 cell division protein FtsA [Oceanicella actignis]
MKSAAFAAQRHMREHLRSALRRGLVGVLDVGTAKTACFILRVDPARLAAAGAEDGRLGGFGAMRVVGAGVTQSRGVRLGEIVDMEEAGRAIRTALQTAEKMAGVRVDQVIGVLPGARPVSFGASADVDVESGEVTEADVARALAACPEPPLEEGREILHALPVNFTVDGQSFLNDPRGMNGRRLSVDMHVLSVASGPLRNLARCVRRCDLELAGVVCAPYAAGLSSLVEDEQELGAACVDMGAGVTSVSIFLRKQLIYADAARVGGAHVTRDVSEAFSIPFQQAERIKTLHGGAVATGMDDRELIAAPRLGAAEDERRISRSALIGVIRPRLEEILEEVRASLDRAGFEALPSRRVVLTGGGSQVPGLEEVARRILGQRVRAGRPLRIGGLPQSASGPAFSAIVGLAAYAVRPQDEFWDFEAPSALDGATRLRRAVRWFRDNW